LMSYTEYDGKVVVKSGCGCKPRICSKIWWEIFQRYWFFITVK
jgi:hypothetical protein